MKYRNISTKKLIGHSSVRDEICPYHGRHLVGGHNVFKCAISDWAGSAHLKNHSVINLINTLSKIAIYISTVKHMSNFLVSATLKPYFTIEECLRDWPQIVIPRDGLSTVLNHRRLNLYFVNIFTPFSSIAFEYEEEKNPSERKRKKKVWQDILNRGGRRRRGGSSRNQLAPISFIQIEILFPLPFCRMSKFNYHLDRFFSMQPAADARILFKLINFKGTGFIDSPMDMYWPTHGAL